MSIRLLFFFFLLCTSAFAQKEYNIWYFGDHAGLDFNSGHPIALTNSAMRTLEACSSICDRHGNLLFYTKGDTVWNREHKIMPNGTNLHGSYSASQAALIIPWPGKKNTYYIFTVDSWEHLYQYGLQYSIVDMALDRGRGDITTKNTPLLAPTSEKLTAAYHSNKRDIWVMVLTHTQTGDSLYSYLMTPSGIQPPVISSLGVENHDGGLGYMKVSPDEKKIALGISTPLASKMKTLLLDFDPSTGIVSHPVLLSANSLTPPYGLEFSPNSHILYIAPASPKAGILQFNLQAGTPDDILASGTQIVPDLQSMDNRFFMAMALGPDGKIYIAKNYAPFLSVINQPDNIGAACQFQTSGVDLLGRNSLWGMPNFLLLKFLSPLDMKALSFCFGDSTLFSLADAVDIDSVRWNFGDPASGKANTVTAFTPLHRFSSPGTYTVSSEFFSGNVPGNSSTTVTIQLPPAVKITVSCNGNGDSYALSAQTSETVTYLWSTGETTADITVNKPGTYWVRVSNGTCFGVDTVKTNSTGIVLKVGTDQAICPGENTQLSASGAASYLWTPTEGLDDPTSATPLASPTTTTTYTVTGTTVSGCSTTAQVTVVVQSLPALLVNKNQEICAGKSVPLSVSGAKNYAWTPTESLDNPLSPTPMAAPEKTTIYTVTGTNEFGCSTSAQVIITVHPLPSLTVSPDQKICAGATVPLSVSGAKSYDWTPAESLDNPASANPRAAPKTTTVYTVTGTDEFGCSTSAHVIITVNTQPAFTVHLGQDTVLCNQPQFLLKTGLTGVPHLWSTGETAEQITVTQSGNYWVSVGSDACAGRDTISVFFENLQLQAKAQKNTICQGEPVQLEASGAATYLWTPSDGLDDPTSPAPLAALKKTTTYTVTGTSQHGCTTQQQLTIKVIEPDDVLFSADNVSGNPGDTVALSLYTQTQHTLPDTLGTVHLQLQTDAFAFDAIGCSPGAFSQKIAAGELTISIDMSEVILTQARQMLTQIQGRVLTSYSSEVPISMQQAQIEECQQKDVQGGILHLTGCSFRNRVVLKKAFISITPNPVSERAEIRVMSEEAGEYSIAIYSLEGQKVWTRTFMQEGQQQIDVPVDHFPAGVYEVILYSPSDHSSTLLHVMP